MNFARSVLKFFIDDEGSKEGFLNSIDKDIGNYDNCLSFVHIQTYEFKYIAELFGWSSTLEVENVSHMYVQKSGHKIKMFMKSSSYRIGIHMTSWRKGIRSTFSPEFVFHDFIFFFTILYMFRSAVCTGRGLKLKFRKRRSSFTKIAYINFIELHNLNLQNKTDFKHSCIFIEKWRLHL